MSTTGSFAIIFDEHSKVLLCHRTDRDLWNLPGGRVQLSEAPWQAVVREVEEETGLHVQVERILGIYYVPARNDLVFNFLCSVVGGALRLTPEADEVAWFRQDDLPNNTSVRQIERIRDAYSIGKVVSLKVQD